MRAGEAWAAECPDLVVKQNATGAQVDITERVRSEPFDLLVLDIGLPGIDGFEVLRRLRAGGSRGSWKWCRRMPGS